MSIRVDSRRPASLTAKGRYVILPMPSSAVYLARARCLLRHQADLQAADSRG